MKICEERGRFCINEMDECFVDDPRGVLSVFGLDETCEILAWVEQSGGVVWIAEEDDGAVGVARFLQSRCQAVRDGVEVGFRLVGGCHVETCCVCGAEVVRE